VLQSLQRAYVECFDRSLEMLVPPEEFSLFLGERAGKALLEFEVGHNIKKGGESFSKIYQVIAELPIRTITESKIRVPGWHGDGACHALAARAFSPPPFQSLHGLGSVWNSLPAHSERKGG
jgi:hypothetical protein